MTLGKNQNFRRKILAARYLDENFIEEVLSAFSSYECAKSCFDEAPSSLSELRIYQIKTAEAKIGRIKSIASLYSADKESLCCTKKSEKALWALWRAAEFFRRLFSRGKKE